MSIYSSMSLLSLLCTSICFGRILKCHLTTVCGVIIFWSSSDCMNYAGKTYTKLGQLLQKVVKRESTEEKQHIVGTCALFYYVSTMQKVRRLSTPESTLLSLVETTRAEYFCRS